MNIKYDPYDDASRTGFRRPRKVATECCAYFIALSYLEDDGEFATREMHELLTNPDAFFEGSTR